MNHTKKAFIQLAIEHNVLTFGQFTLKSGRISPYFFNAGLFYQGSALRQVGQCYANTLVSHGLPVQHLFGPAYKGLPLATATAIALAEINVPVTVTFNRKEVKSHGEGGQLIGAPLSGSTVIIDDVITAGTAFREAQALIQQHGGELTAVLIALDRCERGERHHSAVADIEAQGIRVLSIITLFDLIDYLRDQGKSSQVMLLEEYHHHWGV